MVRFSPAGPSTVSGRPWSVSPRRRALCRVMYGWACLSVVALTRGVLDGVPVPSVRFHARSKSTFVTSYVAWADNGSCFRSDAQFPRGPQEVAHPVTEPPHGVLDVHSGGWDVHDAREPVFHPTLDRDQDPVDHRDGREYNWFASANLVKVGGSGTTTQLSSTPPCCRL